MPQVNHGHLECLLSHDSEGPDAHSSQMTLVLAKSARTVSSFHCSYDPRATTPFVDAKEERPTSGLVLGK